MYPPQSVGCDRTQYFKPSLLTMFYNVFRTPFKKKLNEKKQKEAYLAEKFNFIYKFEWLSVKERWQLADFLRKAYCGEKNILLIESFSDSAKNILCGAISCCLSSEPAEARQLTLTLDTECQTINYSYRKEKSNCDHPYPALLTCIIPSKVDYLFIKKIIDHMLKNCITPGKYVPCFVFLTNPIAFDDSVNREILGEMNVVHIDAPSRETLEKIFHSILDDQQFLTDFYYAKNQLKNTICLLVDKFIKNNDSDLNKLFHKKDFAPYYQEIKDFLTQEINCFLQYAAPSRESLVFKRAQHLSKTHEILHPEFTKVNLGG
ncbi:hypothetical protein EBR43_09160, partial [bacterium]|nr:hypothetical protein [bacterium]